MVARVCALGLVAGLAVSLTGCNAGYTAVGPAGEVDASRRDLVVAVGAEPVNLDFTTTAGAAIPQLLLGNVYETLVTVDQGGAVVPLLAESWTLSEDRTVYEFTLRQGVLFSDGRHMTADDVVASINAVQSEWLNAIKSQMDVVASAEAVGTEVVKVTLAQPSNQWLFSMATAVGAIFPADVNFDRATQTVGTGPFSVVEVSPGNHITLAGRADYWGGIPAMDQITVRYLTDTTASVNGLRSGDIDMIWGMESGDQAAALEGVAGIHVSAGTSTGEVLLSFNNRQAPFDDLRVRQAFAFAIDREAVMESATAGYGHLVAAMVTQQDPYYEDLTSEFAYDPAKAKALLAEAGVTNLHVRFDVPSRPYATTAAQVVQSQLAAVGVTATIHVLEFPAVWLDQVFTRHDFQMSVIMHSEARDLLTVLQPDYYLGFHDPAIMKAAAVADAGTHDEWVSGMRAVVRKIVEETPGVVLYQAPTLIAANENLTGIAVNAVTESMDLTGLRWQ
jgi:peptide/nickel transport system substrate-binding protein